MTDKWMDLSQYTRKSLVVSTSHVPQATDAALFNDESGESEIHCLLSVDANEYGWNIHVSDDRLQVVEECSLLTSAGFVELADLINLASKFGFNFLTLDRDADVLPVQFNLPIFEW